MSPPEPTEDLKAFDRRLREIVDGLEPRAQMWRAILAFAFCLCLITGYLWLTDPLTSNVMFLTSLGNHPGFVAAVSLFLGCIVLGAHKKVVLSNIITQRCRNVLAEYNMTCDNSGKLILMPRLN